MMMIGNTFKGTFNVIRVLNKKLVSSHIDIQLELDFDDQANKLDQISALERMKRWLDEILNGCLAFNTKGELPTGTIEVLDNNLMFCPDEPYDFLLLVLIYSKLNAIGQGAVSVVHCELTSDMGDGFGNWFEGNAAEVLPTLSEWAGERTYFDKPWWDRPDGSMIDMWAGPDDDISKKPDILIDLSAGPSIVSDLELESEPAEIIKPNFKPTIIGDD